MRCDRWQPEGRFLAAFGRSLPRTARNRPHGSGSMQVGMRHVQLVGGSVKIERFGKDSEIAKLAQVHDCNPLSLGEINIGFGFGKHGPR